MAFKSAWIPRKMSSFYKKNANNVGIQIASDAKLQLSTTLYSFDKFNRNGLRWTSRWYLKLDFYRSTKENNANYKGLPEE